MSSCFITSLILDSFRPGKSSDIFNENFCGDRDRLKNITTNLFPLNRPPQYYLYPSNTDSLLNRSA